MAEKKDIVNSKNIELAPVTTQDVEARMIMLRNQPVLIDADVAELYGVDTKRVNEAVKNNPKKFPYGYLFELECFVPMRWTLVDVDTENPRRELVPAINNLIFIRSSKPTLQDLKTRNPLFQPLRYMVDHTSKEAHTVMTIPERQMQNFMLVASHRDDSVMFLDEKSLMGRRASMY